MQSLTGLEAVHNMPGPYIILCQAQIMNHDAQGALTSINKGKNTQNLNNATNYMELRFHSVIVLVLSLIVV